MIQHQSIKNVTITEAINRIKSYCKEHNHIVETNDFEAAKMGDNTLRFHQPHRWDALL